MLVMNMIKNDFRKGDDDMMSDGKNRQDERGEIGKCTIYRLMITHTWFKIKCVNPGFYIECGMILQNIYICTGLVYSEIYERVTIN